MQKMEKATNINVVNAIRNTVRSISYQDRIPEATAANIDAIYDKILQYEPIRNEFVNALIGLIVYQQVETQAFQNPLNQFKMSPMRYGQTEQEIFVNMAKAKDFNQFAGADELYRFYAAEVLSAYHSVGAPRQYPVTVTFDNLRTAFSGEYGLRSLINAKVQSLYTGAEYDDYLLMKSIVETCYKNGYMYPVKVDAVTDEASGKALTRLMKAYVKKMQFPCPDYNLAGATSAANYGSIFYMTTPEADAALSVDVLAYAFNMDKADMDARKVIVDKFDDDSIVAVLFDMRFFRVRDQFRTMSDSRNGAALTWNYFYTVSGQYSFSPFFPVIVFTTKEPSVSTITVDAADAAPGQNVKLKYDITGGDYVPQMLDWEITGGAQSEHTAFIPGSPILAVGQDEKGASISVQAKSRYDGSITGTGTVTVNQ